MQMMFLPNLAKRGISAVLLDDGRVRLSPQANVSDRIFDVAKANKAGILQYPEVARSPDTPKPS